METAHDKGLSVAKLETLLTPPVKKAPRKKCKQPVAPPEPDAKVAVPPDEVPEPVSTPKTAVGNLTQAVILLDEVVPMLGADQQAVMGFAITMAAKQVLGLLDALKKEVADEAA
jgi:hypothetical protein